MFPLIKRVRSGRSNRGVRRARTPIEQGVLALAILLLGIVLGGHSSAWADPTDHLRPGFAPAHMPKVDPKPQHRNHSDLSGVEVTLDKAIRMAERRYGGKALSAKKIRGKGPLVYKVKLLSSKGRVSAVFVDAETGDVFKTRR